MQQQPAPVDEIQQSTNDTGNGNPPPKKPPAREDALQTDSVDETGNGNPPPKG